MQIGARGRNQGLPGCGSVAGVLTGDATVVMAADSESAPSRTSTSTSRILETSIPDDNRFPQAHSSIAAIASSDCLAAAEWAKSIAPPT